jgi:heterodisulfide reductase subunit C
MKKKRENLGIQPLNDDVLANLSIDELEERLELQLLHVTEAQGCWDCGTYCSQCASNSPVIV